MAEAWTPAMARMGARTGMFSCSLFTKSNPALSRRAKDGAPGSLAARGGEDDGGGAYGTGAGRDGGAVGVLGYDDGNGDCGGGG